MEARMNEERPPSKNKRGISGDNRGIGDSGRDIHSPSVGQPGIMPANYPCYPFLRSLFLCSIQVMLPSV